VPFEWPYHPTYPEIDDGSLFVPLAWDQPELAERLRRRYAEIWVAKAHLQPPRIEDAMDTLELLVAGDDEHGGFLLRLRSFYTGTTGYYSWDGSEAEALKIVADSADLQAHNTGEDRRHGPLLWDTVTRGRQTSR
jgi:hypothetical protein